MTRNQATLCIGDVVIYCPPKRDWKYGRRECRLLKVNRTKAVVRFDKKDDWSVPIGWLVDPLMPTPIPSLPGQMHFDWGAGQ